MDKSSFSGDSANLDFIRAVAVLSVFFPHLYEHLIHAHSDWAWRFGQLGVLVFFVHTSFVLMLSLERSRNISFSDFYLRRFFRLYPLAVVFITAVYIVQWGQWTFPQLLSNLLLTFKLTRTQPMWGIMWTLALEVQMYIALPAVFLLCVKRSRWWALALWGLTIPFAVIQPTVSDRLDVIAYAPVFLGGVIGWRLSRESKRKLPAWLWPIAFAAATWVWLSTSRENIEPHRWLFGLILGLAVPFFADLTWRPLVRISQVVAKYSYGIYLSHPAALIVFDAQWPLIIRWAVFVIIAAGAPVLLYHVVEKPMIDLGTKLARKPKARLTAAAATP